MIELSDALKELDPVRHPPELLKVFLRHKRKWEQGGIRLRDYAQEAFTDGRGNARNLWYARPLGEKVLVDKAHLFDMLGYRPSEPACLAHASTAKIRVFSGGARAGKSLWAGHEMTPIVLSPNTRQWIVAPDYELGKNEFEYVLEFIETDEIRKQWAPMLKGGKIRNNPKNGDMILTLKWGDAGDSFIKVKSATRKEGLLGEQLDLVCVVEASQIPEVVWSRYLQMRLTNRRGIAIFPSSPDGTGWYDKLYRQGIHGTDGVFAINADSRMNPTLSLEEIAFWTHPDRMSDEDFEEQVRGRGTPPHGRVYKSFDPVMHVHQWDRRWPLPEWPRGRAFDFGYADPYVILWIAKHGEAFYVYREFYKQHQLTNDVVRHIAEVEGWRVETDEEEKLSVLGDRGREQMSLPSVADWDAAERADLRTRGIQTRKAKKDILPGIRSVAEYLRVLGNGRPRLYISPDCPNLIRELETYEWGPDGNPKANQSDHAVDALRYFMHTVAPRRAPVRVHVV